MHMIYATYEYQLASGCYQRFHVQFEQGTPIPQRYRDRATGIVGTLAYWQADDEGAFAQTTTATRIQELLTWDRHITASGDGKIMAYWHTQGLPEYPTNYALNYIATHDSVYDRARVVYGRCRQLLARKQCAASGC